MSDSIESYVSETLAERRRELQEAVYDAQLRLADFDIAVEANHLDWLVDQGFLRPFTVDTLHAERGE
jgi:hypothetical protein